MRFFASLIALAIYSSASNNLADQETAPYPYVVSTLNSHRSPPQGYYFKMSPLEADPYDRDDGSGTAFQAETGDKDTVLWKTSGWYAYDVYLAMDGKHLVRIGNWPRGKAPKSEDVAVAFYADGKLVKSYSTLELIKDVTQVHASASHYGFLGPDRPRFIKFKGPMESAKDDTQFELSTVDGIRYVFSVEDGQILSSNQR